MKLTDDQIAHLESCLASARFHDAAVERELQFMLNILGRDDGGEAEDWCWDAITASKDMTLKDVLAHIDECRAAAAAIADQEDRRA